MENLMGKQFGRLTVIGVNEPTGQGEKRMWVCRCECGNEKAIYGGSLKSGRTKSCGCIRKETARTQGKQNARHGMEGTRIYTIWGSMLKRCRCDADRAYPKYGGRGITVCPEWLVFENFYKWAIVNGYADHLSLDRKDNNGNYEPGNCHWTTRKVQGNNKGNNHKLTINGETHTIAEWADISGTKRVTIHARLNRGWDAKSAVYGGKLNG